MEKFEIVLSEESIDNLIQYIKDIKKRAEKVAAYITDKSLKEMEFDAKRNVVRTTGLTGYPPTGNLESSFLIRRRKNKGKLMNTDPNSAATEFGTGILGEKRSHPSATDVEYAYDLNDHGEQGWDYWEDGEKYHTYGQVAHRFMYDAILDFQSSGDLEKIGIEAFNKYFGGK